MRFVRDQQFISLPMSYFLDYNYKYHGIWTLEEIKEDQNGGLLGSHEEKKNAQEISYGSVKEVGRLENLRVDA
jgi:hypothetical protein